MKLTHINSIHSNGCIAQILIFLHAQLIFIVFLYYLHRLHFFFLPLFLFRYLFFFSDRGFCRRFREFLRLRLRLVNREQLVCRFTTLVVEVQSRVVRLFCFTS